MLSISSILFFCGCLVLARIVFSLIRGIIHLLHAYPDLRKYGSWAVVTGATDGIGKALAIEMARHGMNLVIIGRNNEKLQTTFDEIMSCAKVEVKGLQIDFSQMDSDQIVSIVENGIKGLKIGVLINNVGMCNPAHLFQDQSEADLEEIQKVNVNSMLIMTRVVIPQMLLEKKGCVINIGSGNGYMRTGSPFCSDYSGTKGFAQYFSRSMHYEYKDQGIIVQCVIPAFVKTKMTRMPPSLFVPTPEAFAHATVKHIGVGGPIIIPYWSHKLFFAVFNFLPLEEAGKFVYMFWSRIYEKVQRRKYLASLTPEQREEMLKNR